MKKAVGHVEGRPDPLDGESDKISTRAGCRIPHLLRNNFNGHREELRQRHGSVYRIIHCSRDHIPKRGVQGVVVSGVAEMLGLEG
jgi:hypothetical protein